MATLKPFLQQIHFMKKHFSAATQRVRALSLNIRICVTATALVIVSLGVTGAVIAMKSSAAAEAAAMRQARSSVHEAANALEGRLGAHLAALNNLAGAMAATRAADAGLTRAQVGEMVKATLLGSDDLIGAAVVWEPNALDGRDAEYANRRPEFDATGRFMPYYSRGTEGKINVEPVVLSEAPEPYDVPKSSGNPFLSEPYPYTVDGTKVLLSTLSVPFKIGGRFQGVATADFMLTRLSGILAEVRTLEGGRLALLSNRGMYASHPQLGLNGSQADNIPAAGLESIRQGRPYEYKDASGMVHLLQPLRLHAGTAPWSVRLSFPESVATAPAREIVRYTLLVAVMCAAATAAVLILVLNRLMKPLRALSVAMTEVAGGEADLTKRLAVVGSDELATISDGFNRFVGKIHDVLAQVRSSSDSVATASMEIRAGNADLSSRTEQQAAALEETASSMEELAGTVEQNAAGARDADALATSASDIASRAGEMVTRVVHSMASIDASSRKVVDIIDVIDAIAFQTNILALNAAVEAARAGEQGRGFAVVATEVRNLAQRSAAAAKQIKDLIGDAVDQVGVGRALVNDAGKTMDAAVDSVRRLSSTIAQIAAASAEQNAGITQINVAVSEMDGMTQQNAALVEEAAAAAESLQQQASMLVQLVGQFQLDSRPPFGRGHGSSIMPALPNSRLGMRDTAV